MAEINLQQVSKTYPNGTVALGGLDLAVEDGELMVLFGPSGSGKTTILRLVAGLEAPSRGTIRIGERVVTDLPPARRDVAMVFQDDTLLPFLTAEENMAFGLRARKMDDPEVRRRVRAEARVLGLDELLERRPADLAMGERQAVAMGRALVQVPSVFLLDEPLARLDAHRRREVRREIALLQQGYGVSMLYATNDREDAMALGDRVAVLDEGSLRQMAPPRDLYHRPVDLFVADFMGPLNLVEGTVVAGRDGPRLEGSGVGLPLGRPAMAAWAGRRILVGLRPDRVRLGGERGTVVGTVRRSAYLGSRVELTVEVGGGVEWTVPTSPPGPRPGDRVGLEVDPAGLYVFDAGDHRALAHPFG